MGQLIPKPWIKQTNGGIDRIKGPLKDTRGSSDLVDSVESRVMLKRQEDP